MDFGRWKMQERIVLSKGKNSLSSRLRLSLSKRRKKLDDPE